MKIITTIGLDPVEWAVLRALGGGNRHRGIRLLLALIKPALREDFHSLPLQKQEQDAFAAYIRIAADLPEEQAPL